MARSGQQAASSGARSLSRVSSVSVTACRTYTGRVKDPLVIMGWVDLQEAARSESLKTMRGEERPTVCCGLLANRLRVSWAWAGPEKRGLVGEMNSRKFVGNEGRASRSCPRERAGLQLLSAP